jgi:hypothetical protein
MRQRLEDLDLGLEVLEELGGELLAEDRLYCNALVVVLRASSV